MHSPLVSLRQTPQPSPADFVHSHPGCWVLFRCDIPSRGPSHPLLARSIDPDVLRLMEVKGRGVFHTLQEFGDSLALEDLLCFRSLGVDVTLGTRFALRTLSPAELDRRKEDYLKRWLRPFPLRPHWLVETQYGFQVIFRVQTLREKRDVCEALVVNRRLAAVLGGDADAVLPAQALRVPGTWQFTHSHAPFLCPLLEDNTAQIAPYPLAAVRRALDACGDEHPIPTPHHADH